MNIDQEKMIVEALPSLYPLKDYEEDAIHTILDAIPKWIPVTERLPERSGDYLITRDVIEGYEKEACSIDYFEADTLDWDGYGDLVTAWMPLQEPYKGVNV